LGYQTQPVVDPNTQELRYEPIRDAQGNPVRRTKGSFFRDILAGAILGGSAGAEAHARNPFGSPIEGAFAGARAGMGLQQEQKERAGEQAVAAWKRRQEVGQEQAKADEEQMHWNATVAHWALQELQSDSTINLNNEKELDEQNNQAKTLLEKVMGEHGALADIPDNGKFGNGTAMMEYFGKHPEAYRGSGGSLRVPVKQVDHTGLIYDPQHYGWKDAKTGEHVDLRDRTTWSVYDINKDGRSPDLQIPVKGSELRSLFPKGVSGNINPDAHYNVSARQLLAIGTEQRNRVNASVRDEMARQRQDIQFMRDQFNGKLENLRTQYNMLSVDDKQPADPGKPPTPGDKLRKELKGVQSEREDAIANVAPFMKVFMPEWQHLHFPWKSLKEGEAAMIDSKGQFRAVPSGQKERFLQQGYREVPTGDVSDDVDAILNAEAQPSPESAAPAEAAPVPPEVSGEGTPTLQNQTE
jgi:hypothetical protein